jgi:hypothetical protein
MSVEEVERILGPGTSVVRPPQVADYSRPSGHYMRPAVWGDEFRLWQGGNDVIVTGLRNGLVCDKWYVDMGYP